MAWRVEWIGGTAMGSPPIGWRRFDDLDHTRDFAIATLRTDPDVELRVVRVHVDAEGDADIDSVEPSAATLTTWTIGAMLPQASRHAAAARRTMRDDARRDAVERLRTVLDQVVESGDLSRGEAARVVATLVAAMIRSASAASA